MELLLTQSTTPIIGQLAMLMGKILDFIFELGVHNIGVCIIILTFIVYLLMLPLTVKQQKFSKLSAAMQPELQALQKKYKNKRDSASMQKMQEEQKLLYEKYGTSPTGGCLNLLITFPLLIAFYSVVRNIPAYVMGLKNVYFNSGVVDAILKMPKGTKSKFLDLINAKPILANADKLSKNKIIDGLWKFNDNHFDKLSKWIPKSSEKINTLQSNIKEYTTFLCYNIAETPMFMMQTAWAEKDYLKLFLAVLLPILSGFTQWLNIKLMPQPQQDPDSQLGSSLKMMNLFMPLFSVYITFTLPIGLGIYWIAAAVFRSIQQICINKYLDKVSIESLIEKGKEKQAKKREKKGLPNGYNMAEKANVYTKSVKSIETPNASDSENTNNSNKIEPKAGSLASKAMMVKKFNEGTLHNESDLNKNSQNDK